MLFRSQVSRGGETVELKVYGQHRLVLSLLRAMRSARWRGWKQPRSVLGAGNGLIEVITALRDLGWIRDDDREASAKRSSTEKAGATLERARLWLQTAYELSRSEAGFSRRFDRVTRQLRRTLARYASMQARGTLAVAADMSDTIFGELYEGVLHLQVLAWTRAAPDYLSALGWLLHQCTDQGRHRARRPAPAPPPHYTEHLGIALCSAISLIVCSSGAPQRTSLRRVVAPSEALALNTLLTSEKTVRAWLARTGATEAFEKKLKDVRARRVAAAIFSSQLHVSEHYVEALFPLLRQRWNRPLALAWKTYFDEEYGHERFDRAACHELGLKDLDLDSFCPMPLFSA